MAKILKDTELLAIVSRIVQNDEIDDSDQYKEFLEDLADVVTKHCGGEVGSADYDGGDGLGYTIAIHVNDSVPPDGGVFADYDTDVKWLDGEETD